jgi:RNA polymerase sigma factor (sigma-70 family)
LIVGSGTAEAEDAAQEALVDVASSIGQLRDPDAVVAWSARIATRRALRSARWERLRRRREHDLWPPPSTELPDGGRRAALVIAFSRLTPRRRATAVLRLYVGLTEAETATVLGTSIGAVKSQLHEARQQLARSLTEAGVAPVTKVVHTEGAP